MYICSGQKIPLRGNWELITEKLVKAVNKQFLSQKSAIKQKLWLECFSTFTGNVQEYEELYEISTVAC